ncbi:MAG: c-type cytochrome [Blastocatellia bacterium]
MRKRIILVSLFTFMVLLLAGMAAVLGVAQSGLTPIQADARPSALETRFFTMAVRASVTRHAVSDPNADALTEEDIQSGAEIYKAMCALCHGQLNGKPSTLGASFYPPAPQLPGHAIFYNEAEVAWIVKHGIRNTAMPAWRSLLSDDDIRKVATFVKRLNEQQGIGEAKTGPPASSVGQ